MTLFNDRQNLLVLPVLNIAPNPDYPPFPLPASPSRMLSTLNGSSPLGVHTPLHYGPWPTAAVKHLRGQQAVRSRRPSQPWLLYALSINPYQTRPYNPGSCYSCHPHLHCIGAVRTPLVAENERQFFPPKKHLKKYRLSEHLDQS